MLTKVRAMNRIDNAYNTDIGIGQRGVGGKGVPVNIYLTPLPRCDNFLRKG